MNELERIISKYFFKDGTAITYSDFNQEEVDKLFRNMKPYERPDILSIYDNKIVAIEHFEFDSYKNNKDGSNYKIQENLIEQKMQKAIKSQLKEKGELMIHDKIKNKLRLAICMSKSEWSGLIYNTKENYEKFDNMLKSIDEEYRTTLINFGQGKYFNINFAMAKLMEMETAEQNKVALYLVNTLNMKRVENYVNM